MTTTTTTDFTCETCYDTETIDQGGREIACPDCPRYHPSSVTIIDNPRFGESSWQRRYHVIDRSQVAGGTIYAGANSMDEARTYQRRRQGVIKAAITRRANKAVKK